MMMNMKSMVFLSMSMIGTVRWLSNVYDKTVVARLPFEPIGLLHGISHRTLEGDDFRDCSYMFFYVLTNMAVRGNLKKFLGFEPPKFPTNGNPFGMPSQEEMDRKWKQGR
jgi:uncharacterized membrane protein (DUF106 family)